MKRLCIIGLFLLGIAACATTPTPEPETEYTETAPPMTAPFPNLGPAPELTNDVWLNVDEPLRLADLRGKVVALEMWTFG